MFDDASLATAEMDSPIGPLRLAAIDDGLRAILFPVQTDIVLPAVHGSRAARAHLSATQRALEQYFAGQPRAFDALTLVPAGTVFQQQVWQALRGIPFGENAQLPRYRRTDRQSERGARGRPGERSQSASGDRALPPGDRQQRHPDRLRWRPAHQEMAAGNSRIPARCDCCEEGGALRSSPLMRSLQEERTE